MNHILTSDYPRLRYPHFHPPKNGGSDGGGFITRMPYSLPPSPLPEAAGAGGGTRVEGAVGVRHGRQRL
jgi:hypothetical protein